MDFPHTVSLYVNAGHVSKMKESKLDQCAFKQISHIFLELFSDYCKKYGYLLEKQVSAGKHELCPKYANFTRKLHGCQRRIRLWKSLLVKGHDNRDPRLPPTKPLPFEDGYPARLATITLFWPQLWRSALLLSRWRAAYIKMMNFRKLTQKFLYIREN